MHKKYIVKQVFLKNKFNGCKSIKTVYKLEK